MHKLKIGVLMGGMTIEKEVSFNSGRTVCDHLDTNNFEVIPIFQSFSGELYILPIKFLHRGKISDFEHRLKKEAKKICWDDLKSLVSFVYLAIHGRYAEDGTVQGMLEILNIPYLGSDVFTSAMSMDKIKQRDFLKLSKINIPKAIIINPEEVINFEKYKNNILEKLKLNKLSNLDLVIKPHKEGSSLGISCIKNFSNSKTNINLLKNSLTKACFIYPDKAQAVLVEEKILGLEFSCIVIEDLETNKSIALPPTEIELEKDTNIFDYEQKYMPGRAQKHTPARCSLENLELIKQTCIKTKEVLNISTIARVDGFLTKDNKVVIIDPNTLSGMSPNTFIFLQAAEIGLSHTDLINHLIYTDLKRKNLLTNLNKNNKKLLNKNNKIKIIVLLGGNSNEKEISLESGRNIIYKLSPEKYSVIPIFINKNFELFKISQKLLVRNKTSEIEENLNLKNKILWSDLRKICDFVFIGLHGGNGENGAIQGALESLKIPYNGPGIFASSLCIDKFKTNKFLTQHNFETPKNYLLSKKNWPDQDIIKQNKLINLIIKNLNFPVIIKPVDDGCSVFVEKINNIKDLSLNINKLFKFKNNILIEEYISGIELTIGVIGNKNPIALPPSQSVVTKDILSMAEKFLPGSGENLTPAPLDKNILLLAQETVKNAYKAIGCSGYSRIDCFYQDSKISPTKKDRIVIIEVNTLPALTPATCLFHQAAEINISPMELIDLIVTLGLLKHNNKFFNKENYSKKNIVPANLIAGTIFNNFNKKQILLDIIESDLELHQ